MTVVSWSRCSPVANWLPPAGGRASEVIAWQVKARPELDDLAADALAVVPQGDFERISRAPACQPRRFSSSGARSVGAGGRLRGWGVRRYFDLCLCEGASKLQAITTAAPPASRGAAPPPAAACAAPKAPPCWRSASRRGFQLAPIQPPVADAVLGHGEVVRRCLHAVLIGVLHDGELLGTAQHARFRVVHLGLIRVQHDGELKVGVARSASSYRVLPAQVAYSSRPGSGCRSGGSSLSGRGGAI